MDGRCDEERIGRRDEVRLDKYLRDSEIDTDYMHKIAHRLA